MRRIDEAISAYTETSPIEKINIPMRTSIIENAEFFLYKNTPEEVMLQVYFFYDFCKD